MHEGLVQLAAVDVDGLAAKLQRLAWQADDALDEVPVRLDGIFEHDDVTASDGADRQNRPFERRRRGTEDELVHQQVIANQQVLLHRSGRDLEGLHDEGADEQRKDHRDDDRLEVLAQRRLPEIGHQPSAPDP